MAHLGEVCQATAKVLKPGGRMLWATNHPTFRIPRQTSWGFDEEANIQYRRLDAYGSPLTIPIVMHLANGRARPPRPSISASLTCSPKLRRRPRARRVSGMVLPQTERAWPQGQGREQSAEGIPAVPGTAMEESELEGELPKMMN